jgi:hypothetical protein
MSVNTPILQKILSELVALRQDMTEIKRDVTQLKSDVAELKENYTQLRYEFNEFRNNTVFFRKSLTLIQEKSDALYMYEVLQNSLPTLNIELHSFGNFYRQTGKQHITDIDGCITLDSIPRKPNTTHYIKNNSLQFKHSQYRNEILFLESKTQLDKGMLDKKLRQFSEIYSIVSNLKSYKEGSDEFMNMINSSPLNRHPSRIYFIFIAEDMAVSMRQILYHINNASLTEGLYKELLYRLFKEGSMFTLLKNTIDDKLDLKQQFLNAESFDEYVNILSDSTFNLHRDYIKSFFTPYKSVASLYAKFKGVVGYSFQTLSMFPASFSYMD